MTEITASIWILSAVVILTAAVLKGLTGFGFALFAVPLLSVMIPIQVLVPSMTLFNLLASIYLLMKIRVKLKTRYFLPMFVASLAGIPIGVYALQTLNEEVLRLLVGTVIVVFSMLLLLGNKREPRYKSKPIVFAGFLSGILGSSVSIDGPPIAFAMNRKKYSKNLFRANFAIFGLLTSFFTSITFFIKGILVAASFKFTAFLFPLLLVGSGLGNRWAKNIKQEKFRKVVIVLNFVTGLAVVLMTVLKH